MSKKRFIDGRVFVNDNGEILPASDVRVLPPVKDFEISSDSITEDFSDYGLFITETVSGKFINDRIYSKKSIKDSVLDGSWFDPYKRRILTDHNTYHNPTVLGKSIDAHFIDLETGICESFDSENPLAPSILAMVLQDNLNKGGDGLSLIEISANSDLLNGIKDGKHCLYSQSSYYEKVTCSVCGENLYSRDCCSHYTGEEYDVEIPGTDTYKKVRCYPILEGKREPVECSSVVQPANGTSILYIYDKKTGECFRADDFDFSKLKGNSSSNGDSGDKSNAKDSAFKKYGHLSANEGTEKEKQKKDNGVNPPQQNSDEKEEKMKDSYKKIIKDGVSAHVSGKISDEISTELTALVDSVLEKETAEDFAEFVVDFAKIIAKTADSLKVETSDSTGSEAEGNEGEEEQQNGNSDSETEKPLTDAEKESLKTANDRIEALQAELKVLKDAKEAEEKKEPNKDEEEKKPNSDAVVPKVGNKKTYSFRR